MSSIVNPPPASILVTTGPDRGKTFTLTEELVHVGTAEGNQIELADSELGEHQLSIMCRNGRYAVYVPESATVSVDENAVPVGQWVWLPSPALIQLSKRTTVRFECSLADGAGKAPAEAAPKTPAAPAPPKRPRKPAKRREARSEKKGKRQAARFITDRSSAPLVELGENGQLPHLELLEGPQRSSARKQHSESNPLVLVGVISASLCLSVLLLFTDFSQIGGGSPSKDLVRRELREFYGKDDEPLRSYQKHLRQAQQAHSRGDFTAERREYRRVLLLLRAEGTSEYVGITGRGKEADERLEELIGKMLDGR